MGIRKANNLFWKNSVTGRQKLSWDCKVKQNAGQILTTDNKEHSRLYLHYRKEKKEKERRAGEKNQVNVRKYSEPVK